MSLHNFCFQKYLPSCNDPFRIVLPQWWRRLITGHHDSSWARLCWCSNSIWLIDFPLHSHSVTEYGNVGVSICKTLIATKSKEIFIFLLPLDNLESVHSFIQQTLFRGLTDAIPGPHHNHSKFDKFHLPRVRQAPRRKVKTPLTSVWIPNYHTIIST